MWALCGPYLVAAGKSLMITARVLLCCRYGCSSHFLWCGERTRQLDHAHVEFMRGIQNPVGVKVSDKMDPNDLVSLIASINPNNTPGRLAIISRMGPKKVRDKLPGLIGEWADGW